MTNYFQCNVRYEKQIENGMLKKVTEPYLVDALSFTEAEARIIKEVTPFISGEFTVSDIKRARISEIFKDETGDRWFKAKVQFVTIDEKSGAEKKTSCFMLVEACDIRAAVSNLDKGMKGTMADYWIHTITETMIMDIFPFDAEFSASVEEEENKAEDSSDIEE